TARTPQPNSTKLHRCFIAYPPWEKGRLASRTGLPSDAAHQLPAVHSVVRRSVLRTVGRIDVAVPLVPLLVAELMALLGLVLPKLGTISVHLELLFMVIPQSAPFLTTVRSVRIDTPVTGAAVAGSIGIDVRTGV